MREINSLKQKWLFIDDLFKRADSSFYDFLSRIGMTLFLGLISASHSNPVYEGFQVRGRSAGFLLGPWLVIEPTHFQASKMGRSTKNSSGTSLTFISLR